MNVLRDLMARQAEPLAGILDRGPPVRRIGIADDVELVLILEELLEQPILQFDEIWTIEGRRKDHRPAHR